MDMNLRELHETFDKHCIVHVASKRPINSQSSRWAPGIGLCSCGRIYVSNTCDPEPTWYSMNSKHIGDWIEWTEWTEKVILGNPLAAEEWAALPGVHLVDGRGVDDSTWREYKPRRNRQ